jgi:hypothetical protein
MLRLNGSRSDRNVVEQTEAHRLVRLGMMAWWSNHRDSVADLSLPYGSTRFDDATARQFSAKERRFVIEDRIPNSCQLEQFRAIHA